MAEFDLDKFQKTPIYAFDFQFMIGDVKDFLEFSERNIDQQHILERQAIARRKDFDDYPPEYRDHLELNADHRYKVSLPLRVRYGALLAFTTSVEWAVAYLNRSALAPVADKKDKKDKKEKTNLTVKCLRQFTASVSLASGTVIENYEALVQIRNCVVHSAGVLDTYRYKDKLPKAIARIPGVSIGNWHFFGDHVCIERGTLEVQIERTSTLVVALHKAMREKGLLK